MKKAYLLLAWFAVFMPESFSQLTFSSLYESYYDDNIFNNYSKISDFVSNATLGAGYNFESGNNNMQFYYMGELSYYQQNIYKSSTTQKYGFVDTYLISEDENPLNIGLNYAFKKNRDDFSVFDFNVFSAYANYMHSFDEQDVLSAGYVFNRNRFDTYSMFSHDENKLFAKFTKSFDTKSTFILGLEYDGKKYITSLDASTAPNQIEQMKYYLHFAQSIDEYNGLSAHALIRKNLNSGTRIIATDDLVFYEEEIFNDNYSNDGYELGLTFTHIFSKNVKARANYAYQTKKFLNLPILDAEGYETSELRSDKQSFIELGLEVGLSNFIDGLYSSVSFLYINNDSNDYFYKYTNSVYSIGFGWEF